MLSPFDILGPGGAVAKRLERYEHREEQLVMADAVQQAFARQKHLAVEAGTGVGKSFAYLVPAVLNTVKGEELRVSDENTIPRCVISTHTISLQEQLIEKDVPFLRSVLPFEFTAVLVKGRSNYLCLRRFHTALSKAGALFEDFKHRELKRLTEWSKNTTDGSKSDLSPEPDREIWNEICCETGNCLGRKCKFYQDCFYGKARRRAANAQILVVNHALLFSDLALRAAGGSILPVYHYLVLDEAHTVEQVAADHLGLSATQGQAEYNLNRLYNVRTHKGLLTSMQSVPIETLHAAQQAVDECIYSGDVFFGALSDWLQKRPGSNGRVREANIVNNPLSGSIRKLNERLKDVMDKIKDPEERQEVRAAKDRIVSVGDTVNIWTGQGLEEESVYWLESSYSAKGKSRVQICASPIDIGPILREQLFETVSSVVMTSATLATSGKEPFKFFKTQIGMPGIKTQLLGSPFNFEEQATLVMLKDALPPERREDELRSFYERTLRKYLTETNGGAFVLFTSYTLLRKTATDLTPWLAERGLPLFVQGEGMQRSEMVRRFKEQPNAVLFGTDSFWQGVDVPGDALRNVIITKLPFPVPSQPVVEAKCELIDKRGGNSFGEYSLPTAVLKFKQGFGRLIRTKSDTGLVVCLDPRIHSKSYGRNFADALPKCKVR
ncbi:MAG: helicase, partial [Planctomycetaceae bacterium]|nr:helicase [Planctomycetaceae bacterium]